MQSRKLAVEGAVEFTPRVFSDERGMFVSPFQESVFAEAVGRPLFTVRQTSYSRSRRGTVRGIHYTATPPGAHKYVCCVQGKALDIVVDIRVGSPTFGRFDVLTLDPENFRAVYFPLGVGHAFVALADDTVMSYTLSTSYVAENELALAVLDPELALPIPGDIEPILSDRDRVAPTLAEAKAAGLLPDYHRCTEIEYALRRV
ncbi:dTDP-4-dehydrorhamnose 3,5-epimerase family protein [Nocardia terpenica]|uniref:dTDP-4-dehydrorhamnose 3,5-epimerase family protein n=1 Tax=Nocardia terpenica TaxID=455432 RepID=UPI001893C264|nr:dTDP-4-dehydrorhamnose 3,5-epimerase family protein [Nocardia terpenica]MBF6063714.1 dTDP-4-dehydrorhamnose 3,5-epimerase family protein [Nocardia terpenica]MBF6107090.1 dTDP-4-dehydrorhamnose 3,5-epimerase family protein [Nocardia terpenica]MBF6114263.1 dTDP-4-dehydrorhamnose 3,5-epimerase family protein [Nocardia terpenica]MBF6121650.1 dTDP-4-dehydrorhamnose 3,5-epimerase family protein [Nocardia terpenica]MBF6154065.1 dTDP-4-dehydrorhamnose 3,5-epimerase family protein [Nocardia terpenic